MAIALVTEDATYQCAACGHALNAKKGQLLPPCPRCGGKLEKHDGPPAPSGSSCCEP